MEEEEEEHFAREASKSPQTFIEFYKEHLTWHTSSQDDDNDQQCSLKHTKNNTHQSIHITVNIKYYTILTK